MRITKIVLSVLACVFGWSVSQATVTSIPSWNYSGGIYCYSPQLSTDGSGNQTVTLNGYQWTDWGAMGLNIQTDTPSDPTLTIGNTIDNQSSFVWTEYIVNVAMNQTFTLSGAVVNSPPGWAANVTQPGAPVGGTYTGTIDYYVTGGGTPVAIYPAANSTFDFSYKITFSGSTSYNFTESATAVPEPASLSFLAAGGLLVGVSRLRKPRQRILA